jgi:hypothetical protein
MVEADAPVGLPGAEAMISLPRSGSRWTRADQGIGFKISPLPAMPTELLVPNGNFPSGDSGFLWVHFDGAGVRRPSGKAATFL